MHQSPRPAAADHKQSLRLTVNSATERPNCWKNPTIYLLGGILALIHQGHTSATYMYIITTGAS